jgi:hypothetical protein
MKSKFLNFLCAMMLVGCGSNDSRPQPQGEDVQALLATVGQIESDMERGLAFTGNTEEDRTALESILRDIRISVHLLGDGANTGAISNLHKAAQNLSKLTFMNTDRSKAEDLITKLNKLVGRLAREHNLKYDDIFWPLYSYDFSKGLEPFQNVSTFSPWSTDMYSGRTFAKISGFENRAWLVSPKFDLTKVASPKFQMRHGIDIKQNFKESGFDRAKILKTAFKVYVSSTYKNGNPEKAKWDEIDLGKMPTSIDFHTVTTQLIDLKKYQGKQVTFAILFDMDKSLGKHNVIWQIENFAVLGSLEENDLPFTLHSVEEGRLPPNPDRGESGGDGNVTGKLVFGHDFSDGFGGFQQATLEGTPAEWDTKTIDGVERMKVKGHRSSGNFVGTTVLYSSPIDLSASTDVEVQVTQSINFYYPEGKALKLAQPVVALVDGAFDPLKAEWIGLEFTKVPVGDNWDVVTSEWLKLPSEVQGKKVAIGFRYRSTVNENEAPAWDVFSVRLQQPKE